jgi:hypothetical protein
MMILDLPRDVADQLEIEGNRTAVIDNLNRLKWHVFTLCVKRITLILGEQRWAF